MRTLDHSSRQTRERMKAKEWLAIIISIAALGISAVTAYFTLILQSEEMRVFVGEIPLLDRTTDVQLQIIGSLDVAFMNTGTRPILVRQVGLIIRDVSARRRTNPCGAAFSGGYMLEGESFVVKEKESVTKRMKLRVYPREIFSEVELGKDGNVSIQVPKDLSGKPSRHLVTCLSVFAASPSRPSLSADLELAEYEWSAQGPLGAGYGTVSFVPESRAGVFWTKRGTIFNID